MNDLIELISGGSFVDGVLELSYTLTSPEFFFRVIVTMFILNLLYQLINLFNGLK